MLTTGHHLHQPGSTSIGLFVTHYSANSDYGDRDFSSPLSLPDTRRKQCKSFYRVWSPPTTVSWNPVGNTVILPPVCLTAKCWFTGPCVQRQWELSKETSAQRKAKWCLHWMFLTNYQPSPPLTIDYPLICKNVCCITCTSSVPPSAQAINIDTTKTRPAHKNCFFYE